MKTFLNANPIPCRTTGRAGFEAGKGKEMGEAGGFPEAGHSHPHLEPEGATAPAP